MPLFDRASAMRFFLKVLNSASVAQPPFIPILPALEMILLLHLWRPVIQNGCLSVLRSSSCHRYSSDIVKEKCYNIAMQNIGDVQPWLIGFDFLLHPWRSLWRGATVTATSSALSLLTLLNCQMAIKFPSKECPEYWPKKKNYSNKACLYQPFNFLALTLFYIRQKKIISAMENANGVGRDALDERLGIASCSGV